MHIAQLLDGLYRQQQVLALLDGAYTQNKLIGQVVGLPHTCLGLGRYRLGKNRVAPLIHHINLVGRDAVELHDVALGTLAHRHNAVGLATSIPELVIIDDAIQPVIILRITQENQVMNGHHAAYSRAVNPHGQLIAQAVVQLHPVLQQTAFDKEGAPQSLATFHQEGVRLYRSHILVLQQGVIQRILAFLGNVHSVLVLVAIRSHRLYHESAVIAQPGKVGVGSLCIKSYNHSFKYNLRYTLE